MKKTLLISLAVVLALGAMGVAAALWSGWLYIYGDVYTGSVGAEWSIEAFYDNEVKDYSYIDAYLWAPNDMGIFVWNAYPCVTYTVEWNIECTGTVPIHFDYPYIYGSFPEGTTFTFTDLRGEPIEWWQLQLHPGDIFYGKLTIHLNNNAEQNAYYWFYIDLQYGQYNEFPVLG